MFHFRKKMEKFCVHRGSGQCATPCCHIIPVPWEEWSFEDLTCGTMFQGCHLSGGDFSERLLALLNQTCKILSEPFWTSPVSVSVCLCT